MHVDSHLAQGHMSKYSFYMYLMCDLKFRVKYPSSYKYTDDKPSKKPKQEFLEELEKLQEAHPSVSLEELYRGTYTHLLMTGGKFLFNDEPIPTHVVFPNKFAKLHGHWRESAPRLVNRPDTYEDMFWLMLREVIVNKNDWVHDACFTEAISRPYHRFFLDLDMYFRAPHESVVEWNAFVKKLASTIGKAVMGCFPDVWRTKDANGDFEFSIACTKGYRPKELENGTVVHKRGVHMVWFNLVTDKATSETLARVVDEHLTRDIPRDIHLGENTWKDAVDLSVYRVGLRPVGCAKYSACKRCQELRQSAGKKTVDETLKFYNDKSCHPNMPKGFQSQGEASVYFMEYIARADGFVFSKKDMKLRMLAHVKKDPETNVDFDFSLQAWTSIRTKATDPTPGFVAPSHLRNPLDYARTDHKVDVAQDPESGNMLPPMKRAKSSIPKKSFAIALDPGTIEKLLNFLRNFDDKYKNVLVDRVWAFPTDDPKAMLPPRSGTEAPKRSLYSSIWVTCKGEGSHYCLNKPGVHASNQIKFHIDYKGHMVQSCWSQKVYHGKPCCKQTTKGKSGLNVKDEIHLEDLLVDMFTCTNMYIL